MPHRSILRLWLVLAIPLFAACRDVPSAPAAGMGAPAAMAASARRISPYACFVSAAMEAGAPSRFRYRKPELHFPASAIARGGATRTYRYRAYAGGEAEPVYVANCVIPATDRATVIMDRIFHVARQKAPGGGSIMAGSECVLGGTCEIDGLTVNACQYGGTYPYCKAKTYPGNNQEVAPCNADLGDCGTGGYTGGYTGGDAGCTGCMPDAATLSCTASVTRGEPVTCALSGESIVTVGQWTWTAGNNQYRVVGPVGVPAWSGPGVQEGTVRVPVTDGGGARTLAAQFSVSPRRWSWGAAQWTFTQGAGAERVNAEPAEGVMLGWNCNRGDLHTCQNARRVQPDIAQGYTGGYEVAPVRDGPNAGIWYVTEASFTMDRVSGINPMVLESAPKRLLPESVQAQDCRTHMGLPSGTPVYVNFYTFNRLCKGVDIDRLVQGIYAHEGFGSRGRNGHEAQAQDAAAEAKNNVPGQLEEVVRSSEFDIRGRVNTVFHQMASDIQSRGSVEPTGNFSGSVYFWDPATNKFVFTVARPL